ncbi:MAG: type I-C CRISPR-associated protein Cas8c/Csd1 [Coriobacteriales bacterium]|nr:type I-C CRISPR-associated protein Cas8c/Csd1 [Coriobacteriales bacterium]
MILKELSCLYDRLIKDPRADMPTPNWSKEKVSWILTIDKDGQLQYVSSAAIEQGSKAPKVRIMSVPKHTGRSGSAPNPYFLCDSSVYLLGIGDKRAEEKRMASKQLHETVLQNCDDAAAHAILRFFANDHPLGLLELNDKNPIGAGFLVFMLLGDSVFLHQREPIRQAWEDYNHASNNDAVIGQCGITGERTSMARLFPLITGLPGAQTSGASLVSYNFKSAESYGKEQAYNASISESVANKAGEALKYLAGEKNNRSHIGGNTIVFWTEKPMSEENALIAKLFEADLDFDAMDQELVNKIKEAYELMRAGQALTGFDTTTNYYSMCLAPNAARLAVRFFEQGTLGDLAGNYGRYLSDIEMIDVTTVSPFVLLRQTALMNEDDKIPSTIINPFMAAVYKGTDFPRSVGTLLLSRMRSDHGLNKAWDMGQRAALMKGLLVRRARQLGTVLTKESEIDMALSRECTNEGYLLGRLFAVMKHAQSAAIGNTNATIQDRYMGSASSTPRRVFQPLMKGFSTHIGTLRKKRPGIAVRYEKEAGEIIDMLSGDEQIPATLSDDDQLSFFIGFYQEDRELWKKSSNSDEETLDELEDEN